jgi:chromosome segregation ATPase
MPSPFSDKERDLLGRIRQIESDFFSAQKSVDSWDRDIAEYRKQLEEKTSYRNNYAEKAREASELLVKLKEELRKILTTVEEPTAVETEPLVVEDCIDQLESRSKVEAPHARDKVKRSAGKGRNNKGRSR